MERFRSPYPEASPLAAAAARAHTEAEDAEHWGDDIDEAVEYDRGTRSFRDAHGQIVTKHNPAVTGRRNRQRMEADFPIGFAAGDLKGGRGEDVRISNRVYNTMRRFATKEEKATARLHEKVRYDDGMVASCGDERKRMKERQ